MVSGLWAVADQAMASISNLVLAVLVARNSSPADFGAYSLAFAAYVLATGLSRAVWCDAFMIRYAAQPAGEQRQHHGDLLGVGLSVGTGGAVILLASAALAGGKPAGFLTCVAIALPGLVMQDCWRQAMFASHDSKGAFFCDLTWLVVEIPLLVVGGVTTSHKSVAFVAAWAAAGAVTSVLYVVRRRVAPSLAGAVRLTRATRSLLPGLFGEFLALTGGQQLLPYGIAAVAGLRATGELRAAQLVLGLATVPLAGLVPLVLSGAVRSFAAGGMRRLHRLQGALIAPGCAWVLLFGLVCDVMPTAVGRAIAGASWNGAHHLVPALTISAALGWVLTVNVIALRAATLVRLAAVTRTIATVTLLGLTLGLAAAFGTTGAAWGMALAGLVGAFASIWSSEISRSARAH